MTVALVVPHSASMPGYNNTVDLDEVNSLSSDYSFSQTMVPSSGVFSFSQTEPSADLLNASWATEGSQNFQDFPDSGSSHSGDAEDFLFTSGHTTPRGSRLDQTHTENAWVPGRPLPSRPEGQPMSRANSSRSNGSSLSCSSHPSTTDVRGNASIRTGSQAPVPMSGMDPCLLLDSDTNASTSQMYWPNFPLDMTLPDDSAFAIPEVGSLHVAPAQMQLAGDLHGLDTSSPSSWDQFSSSISRTSSPATIDEAWLSAPLSPNSSPEIACQSPSSDRKIPIIPEDLGVTTPPQLDDNLKLVQPFVARRQSNDGESARDHHLYKNATPQADGLYHCPWEGDALCNHKPEKLKCNYDKFVDSHLKPYRCKAESCENTRFSSTACLLRHEREAHGLHGHGDKPFLCLYQGCERAVPGNGFPRQWNLRDHMKRVHNDHGSAGGSPPASASQQSAKGRKRKTEAPEPQNVTSRKAAVKAMPPPEPQPVSKPLLQQWMDHRKAVEDIVGAMEKPEEPRTLQRISEIQRHLNHMAQITSNMHTGPTRRNYITG